MVEIARQHWQTTAPLEPLKIVDEPLAAALVKYRWDRKRVDAGGNLISSHIPGSRSHAPIIDLDFRHRYVTSTQDGHAHLYLDVPISRLRWTLLMVGLYAGGVIEQGYFWWSLRRGANFVRPPGVQKMLMGERVTYTYGLFRKLPQYRRRSRWNRSSRSRDSS